MTQLKLEVGKTYISQLGYRWTIIYLEPGRSYLPFVGVSGNALEWFSRDGHSNRTKIQLVKEYVEPRTITKKVWMIGMGIEAGTVTKDIDDERPSNSYHPIIGSKLITLTEGEWAEPGDDPKG